MTALGINRIRLEFKVNGRYIRGFIAPVLIESDWNLKQSAKGIFLIAGTGINRIRLEFKDNLTDKIFKPIQSINRIRLEFKVTWKSSLL